MPQLTTETLKQRGIHQVTVVIGTGTATLKIKVEGVSVAQPIPDGSFTESTIVNIEIPEGLLSADLTGDAQVFVDFVSVD